MKVDKAGKSRFYFLLVFGFLFILFFPPICLFLLYLFVPERETKLS